MPRSGHPLLRAAGPAGAPGLQCAAASTVAWRAVRGRRSERNRQQIEAHENLCDEVGEEPGSVAANEMLRGRLPSVRSTSAITSSL